MNDFLAALHKQEIADVVAWRQRLVVVAVEHIAKATAALAAGDHDGYEAHLAAARAYQGVADRITELESLVRAEPGAWSAAKVMLAKEPAS